MSYLDRTFSYFPSNIKITKPLGELSLGDMLKAIKKPRKETVEIFKAIEKAAAENDLKTKAELKSKLYYFTPCVKLDGNGRSYSNVLGFTSLAVLDFDSLEPQHALEFQKYLFDTYPYIIATMLSASKKGIKAIVNIDEVSTVDEFKSVFYALAAEMEQYEGFDGTSQNPVLSFYLTYSPELLYRLGATVFKGRGYKPSTMKVFEGEYEMVENVSEDDRNHIKNILRKSMEKITDSAHFICRSTALSAGGFAGAGYFTIQEMEDYMFDLIENTDYCHKSLSLYKNTARDFINKGFNSPLFLDQHKPQ